MQLFSKIGKKFLVAWVALIGFLFFIYGLLDSHTLLSGNSSVRLDIFVYSDVRMPLRVS